MNRIEEIVIDGKRYKTMTLSPCAMTEFITDIMIKSDTQAVLDKYQVWEIRK